MKVELLKKTWHWMPDLKFLAERINSIIEQTNTHDEQVTVLQSQVSQMQKEIDGLKKMRVSIEG